MHQENASTSRGGGALERDQFIPKLMFDLGLMPLFMVEHMVVATNPNSLDHDVTQEVSFNSFTEILRDPFPIQGLLIVKNILVAGSNPTKFMYYVKRGPSPSFAWMQSHNLCFTDSLVFGRQ